MKSSFTKIAAATATAALAGSLALAGAGSALADQTPQTQGGANAPAQPQAPVQQQAPVSQQQPAQDDGPMPANLQAPDPATQIDAPAPGEQLPDLSQQLSQAATAEWPHASLYKGRVIARTGLRIRQQPNTHSRILGVLPYGSIVWIQCKVNSQVIDGNPRWYKLAKNYWAWSAARYIVNIGPAPRFCHFRSAVHNSNDWGSQNDQNGGWSSQSGPDADAGTGGN
jgi:hypothetical protein